MNFYRYKLICNRTPPTKNLSIKRDLYISINHSAMLLVKQQCKAEWISFGDECTRVFMAKMKQRKAWTSIYHINDQHDQRVEGFEAVSKVMTNYYKKLLGEKDLYRTQVDTQFLGTSLHPTTRSVESSYEYWVHGRCLKGRNWWEYTPRSDTSWYWKKLQHVKTRFKDYPREVYRVTEGYNWLLQGTEKPKWVKLVWSRTCIPRHSFTMWLFMQSRLPVLQRMGRYTATPSTNCPMCKQSPETHEHLFVECTYAKDIWSQFYTEWNMLLQLEGKEAFITSMCKMRKPRKIRSLI
ncbi:hypothetical protein Cgig2_009927 [Carnegiea gigantea]|uniref:Reverse transcriptase zinc-binding domain-containing protein n=1 Tax=Carnegiea gigantea TaxID=171969 RepID=A0A9Q1QBU2_9CARY|nr:hypothetical protein Cgig2_009927 [Carnegiea gigantea]